MSSNDKEYKTFREICKDFVDRSDYENLLTFIKLNVENEEEKYDLDYVEMNFYCDKNYSTKYNFLNGIYCIDLTNTNTFDFINNFDEITEQLAIHTFPNLEKIFLPEITDIQQMKKFLKKVFPEDKINKFPRLRYIQCNSKITEGCIEIINLHFWDYTFLKRKHIVNGECFIEITNTQLKDFTSVDFYGGRYCGDKKKVLLDDNDVVKSYLRIKASK